MIWATVRHDSRDSQDTSQQAADQTSTSMHDVTAFERTVSADHRLTVTQDSSDPRGENIRMLCTELLLRRESSDRADIIALVSPCAGEGRSMLAAELAIAFARTGCATLLVDADLRRPHQHLLFDTDNQEGLSQAIESGSEPRLHAVRGLPRMSVLTSGGVPGNPLELLSSKRFAQMIEAWRDDWKFVVIDTAPAGYFADALAVASVVGRVLTLSRAQHTSYKDMQEMLRRLGGTRAQILGAVISHF